MRKTSLIFSFFFFLACDLDFQISKKISVDEFVNDEMKSFNQIYENNGGGVLGFMFGVAANPTVIGQLFVSSVASMVNPDVIGGAAAAAGRAKALGPLRDRRRAAVAERHRAAHAISRDPADLCARVRRQRALAAPVG